MFDKIKAFLTGSNTVVGTDVQVQPVHNASAVPSVLGDALTMSSREIAELTGKEHKHIIRDIRVLLAELDGPDLDHVRTEQDVRGYTACIHLPKDLTLTLVSGYNVRLRHVIIKRWQELETAPQPKQMDKATMTLLVIEDLMQQADTAKALLVEAAPKVEFHDNYVEADGLIGFREVAKLLQMKEKTFRQWLVDNKVMYKGTSGWAAYQVHTDAGRFVSKTFYDVYNRAQISSYFTAKGVEWVAKRIKGNE